MPILSSDYSVSVRGLRKEYRIADPTNRATTLPEAVGRLLRNPGRRISTSIFTALEDVSFEAGRGEVIGVIGRNGAGKSTLLKILSRITAPSAGEVRMRGRASSLLEVGTGFHPELTGRENIYLNGAILGMRRKEIALQFDAIVDFAEVDRFLDTPVKRYSSGMYVRLAFAVAAHLSPEILIVDEVLSVGDAEFQRKCLGKMRDVTQSGGPTVFFVSHNMSTIETLCPRAILMRSGRVEYDGPAGEAIARYARLAEVLEGPALFGPPKAGSPARFVAFTMNQGQPDAPPMTGRPLVAHFTVDCDSDHSGLSLEFVVTLRTGRRLLVVNSHVQGVALAMKAGRNYCRCTLSRCHLAPGTYDLEVHLLAGAYGTGFQNLHSADLPDGLRIHSGRFYPTGIELAPEWAGMVQFESEWVSGPE